MATRPIAEIGADLQRRRQERTYASTRLVSRYLDVSDTKVRQLERGEEFNGWREVARRYRTILPILEDQAQREEDISHRIQALHVESQRWALTAVEATIRVLEENNLIALPTGLTYESLRQPIQNHMLSLIMGTNLSGESHSEAVSPPVPTAPASPARRTPANSAPLVISPEEEDDDDFIDSLRRAMDER